jgi:hypothetical protein
MKNKKFIKALYRRDEVLAQRTTKVLGYKIIVLPKPNEKEQQHASKRLQDSELPIVSSGQLRVFLTRKDKLEKLGYFPYNV